MLNRLKQIPFLKVAFKYAYFTQLPFTKAVTTIDKAKLTLVPWYVRTLFIGVAQGAKGPLSLGFPLKTVHKTAPCLVTKEHDCRKKINILYFILFLLHLFSIK